MASVVMGKAILEMSPAEWIQSHNFAGLSPRTISAINSTLHLTSGGRIHDVWQMFFLLKGTSAISLKRQGVVGYLIATASNAMAIKPGLQFSPPLNGIITGSPRDVGRVGQNKEKFSRQPM